MIKQVGAVGLTGAALPNLAMAMSFAPKNHGLDLSTPEKKSTAITKIMGSIGKEEVHAFMRIHLYALFGHKNVVPMFSLNNYVVQKWTPSVSAAATYDLKHYEVGYFCKFDTDEPITYWKNPVTGETVELEQFILGPVPRSYTPSGIIAPGIAPNPLRISTIEDRVFVPAQSIEEFPNPFSPEDWPEHSSGPVTYWDSMYTFSADVADVVNPKITSAPAEMHMQNLTSFQPFLKMRQTPGRSMARGFGKKISGFDALQPTVRASFEKHTPEIFETDTETTMRFDSVEYYTKMLEQRNAKGEQQ